MIEVWVKNFQSLSDAHITIDGFTTIVGRNYLGKSAILRAINAALTNQQGTDFITWGETFCEVRIKMNDLDILWHKEEGNNYYEIKEGDKPKEKYTKIGKDVPPDQVLKTGYSLINVGGTKVNLNYAVQFLPLFLVDKQDSKGVDLLTSVYGLDRLYKAIDLCNVDERKNKEYLGLRETDLQQAEDGLEKFRNWDDTVSLVQDVKAKKLSLEKREDEILSLKGWYQKVLDLLVVCRKLQTVKDVHLPTPNKLKKEIASLQAVMTYDDALQKSILTVKKLQGIAQVTLPQKLSEKVSKNAAELKRIQAWAASYEDISAALARLKQVETVKVSKPDINLEVISSLKKKQELIVSLKTDLMNLKTDIESSREKQAALKEEKKKYKNCPLCGSDLTNHDPVSHVQ